MPSFRNAAGWRRTRLVSKVPSRSSRSSTITPNNKRVGKKAGRKTKVGSKTRTKTNSKIETYKDGPVSDSYFFHSMKHMSLGKFKQTGGVQSLVTNKTAQITWASGSQGGYGILPWYSAADLILINSTWNTLFPNIVNNGNTLKMFHKQCYGEVLMTNQTNDIAHVTLYDVIARHDINNTNYTDPWSAWIQACADLAQVTAYSVVGANPFNYPGFTENYRVLKVTHLDLHTGGHHRHTFKVKAGQMFSAERLATMATGSPSLSTLGNLSGFTMIVAHGYPLNNPANSVTTTGTGKIDVVQKREYSYYGTVANKSFVALDDQLNKSLVPATEQIVTDLTGLVVPVAQA